MTVIRVEVGFFFTPLELQQIEVEEGVIHTSFWM
jgi:hypothetical protein